MVCGEDKVGVGHSQIHVAHRPIPGALYARWALCVYDTTTSLYRVLFCFRALPDAGILHGLDLGRRSLADL
jgi:hypothetical protein